MTFISIRGPFVCRCSLPPVSFLDIDPADVRSFLSCYITECMSHSTVLFRESEFCSTSLVYAATKATVGNVHGNVLGGRIRIGTNAVLFRLG